MKIAAASLASDERKTGAISIQALRTFAAVVDSKSFSLAAKQRNVSQPTISFQISGLEASFGARLFHRKPRLELTDVGRELFARTRVILDRFDDLETSLDEMRNLQRGRITLGYSAPRTALPIVAKFMNRYPAVSVKTVFGNTQSLLGELEQCRIDLAIISLEEPVVEFGSQLIEPQHLCVWLPPGHPLIGRPSLSLEEVVTQPLVTREQGSITRALFERACDKRNLKPQIRLEVDGRAGVREAVAAGIGLGIVLSSEAPFDTRLAFAQVTGAGVTAGTYVVYLKEMLDLPAVQAMIDLSVVAR